MTRPFLVIAHRGAPNHAPENTLAAFDKALALGFPHIELDAQLSADGVPVVFHDDTLERTTDGAGPLAARTLAELKRLDAGAWYGAAFRGERIPTLEEVLVRYRGRAYLHLELKSEEAELPSKVAALLVKTGWPVADPPGTGKDWPETGVTISSFHKAQLIRMRPLLPRAPLAWLVAALTPGVLDEAKAAGFQMACPRADGVSEQDVEAAGARGLRVRAWGLRDTAQLTGLVERGVEGTTCDWPDVAREHLTRLGVPVWGSAPRQG
jgi:glycerophosphoryl diester phosphodiesterase